MFQIQLDQGAKALIATPFGVIIVAWATMCVFALLVVWRACK